MGGSEVDGTQLVVTADEAKALKSIVLENILATAFGKSDGLSSSRHSILVVSHYDTFGIAPVRPDFQL